MRRILFANTYYDKFLNAQPLDPDGNYSANLQKRINSRFGDSDFYTYWLRGLGWDAIDVITNDHQLQKQWAIENQINAENSLEIFIFQVLTFNPSIVYFQDISLVTNEMSGFLRSNNIKICGQHASPLPPNFDFRSLDLFISSMPYLIDVASSNGINAIYIPLAFDERILNEVAQVDWTLRSAGGFVGGFTSVHTNGVELILSAMKAIPSLSLYGYGWDDSLVALLNGIPWKGEVWGLDMFALLGRWKISLNRHIDMSGMHSNNMRLYESTGMGALLITDKKEKNKLFSSGSEMVEYENIADLKEKLLYFYENPIKAREIAEKGQKNTLQNHTYRLRMAELSSYLERL